MKAVVFTRPPVPGAVKTRLVPALGAEGAARLHAAMAEDVVALVRAAGLELKVSVAGGLDHPWVRGLDCEVEAQVPGDLGARMRHALRGPSLALGSDSPTLPLDLLRRLAAGQHELAVGPAFDGGYWGLAWRRPRPELLEGIPWSTDAVFAETVLRVDGDLDVLPFWYDVDTPDALSLLRQHLRTLPSTVAPRTRACLSTTKGSPRS